MADAPVETLLSSEDLVAAGRVSAVELGYDVVIDNHCDDWDYADASRYLLHRFAALPGRRCLLSAGEVTVRLSSDPGVGGRNQQFALACALALEEPVVVLSAGSDGIDGNSPAAGAIADENNSSEGQSVEHGRGILLAKLQCSSAFRGVRRHAGHWPDSQ